MSKLSKFIGVAKEVEIRGEKLNLYQLTMEDMQNVDRLVLLGEKYEKGLLTSDEEKEIQTLNFKLIKQSYLDENLTDEQLIKMPLSLFEDLMVEIFEEAYSQKNGKGINRIRELKEKAVQQANTK